MHGSDISCGHPDADKVISVILLGLCNGMLFTIKNWLYSHSQDRQTFTGYSTCRLVVVLPTFNNCSIQLHPLSHVVVGFVLWFLFFKSPRFVHKVYFQKLNLPSVIMLQVLYKQSTTVIFLSCCSARLTFNHTIYKMQIARTEH